MKKLLQLSILPPTQPSKGALLSKLHLAFILIKSMMISNLLQLHPMSKHSKNNTNSSVFTYMERQKLKAEYGTHHSRIGQDSLKPFNMCTLCHTILVEPTTCNEGHVFCRTCVVQFLVKQKKKIKDNEAEVEKMQKKKLNEKKEEALEAELKKLEQFQKYDTFGQITGRQKLVAQNHQVKTQEPVVPLTNKDVKPTGIYQLNPKKDQYVKAAFWSLENTPANIEQVEKESKVVICPGGGHKLTLKKLRNLKIKEEEKEFSCWICRKEIHRQKVGCYKCGHIVCFSCKSTKCELCEDQEGWMDIDNGGSAYAQAHKAEVTTYTHAFVG